MFLQVAYCPISLARNQLPINGTYFNKKQDKAELKRQLRNQLRWSFAIEVKVWELQGKVAEMATSATNSTAFLRFQVIHLDLDRSDVVIAINVKETENGNLVQHKPTFYRKFGDWFDCHIRPGRVLELMLQDSEAGPVRAHCTLLLSAISKNCDIDGAVSTVPIVLSPVGKLTLQVKYFQGRPVSSASHTPTTERSPSSNAPAVQQRKIVRRGAQKLPKVHLVSGHHFVAKFFNQLTFCSFCNDFLWGFNKQGYSCELCNVTVHKRCHDKVIDVCTRNAAQQSDLIDQVGQRLGFAVPHVFKPKNFLRPVFCRHCGQLLWGLYNQGQECKNCHAAVHHKCRDICAKTCGVNMKQMVQILNEIHLGRQNSTSSTRPLSLSQSFDTMSILTSDDEELAKPVYEDPSLFMAETGQASLVSPTTTTTTTTSTTSAKATASLTKKLGLSDFEFVRLLGKGSFGKVFLAHRKSDRKQCYAIKAMRIDFVLSSNDVETTRVERKVLQVTTKARAPFLLHMLCTFKSDSHLFYVLDFLPGGDLMFHLQQSESFDLARTRFYAAEIVAALSFLHHKKVIYRDLKLDNVLLDREGHVCLADFGMCKDEVDKRKATTFCGTLDYIAPEIIEQKEYSYAVDWWSFGVLVFEMITGQTPFYGDLEEDLFREIKDPSLPDMSLVSEPSCVLLLQQLFQRDPARRLGDSDIKAQAFFVPALDWGRLERRQVAPPFVPSLQSSDDVRYFERDFTRATVRISGAGDSQLMRTVPKDLFNNFSLICPDYVPLTSN